MITTQIMARGVLSPRTLDALREVPRHRFVPPRLVSEAYADRPLPIGHGQTISQPFIVAVMTALLGLRGDETVLEVGAGCGYQSAVLSRVAARVFAIEIVEDLALEARA
ncbi:MAG: protein-L-isoaspartate O-methyltransferase, partial [Vicinamibacteria bacterium]